MITDTTLEELQKNTFTYFLEETNTENGLVHDSTRGNKQASTAGVGFGLSCYPVGVERNFISRDEAIKRTLTTLRFLRDAPQNTGPDASGYKGFFYHFLDMETGLRVNKSELSTMDTALLMIGVLAVRTYFDRDTAEEIDIRALADELYGRVDWQWALNGSEMVSMGWSPEEGFLPNHWQGYNEGLLLYILGLGSPTHPLGPGHYEAWTATYEWKKIYEHEYLYAGPLFIHQMPHCWIDFRGIQDAYMRDREIDYFENSRRATYIQRQYAIQNPRGYVGYGENAWGITASDGPGPLRCEIDGVEHYFYAYEDRGVPYGPDDGTLAPWGTVASLPFAPEIVLPALEHFNTAYPDITNEYGLKCSFNPTFPGDGPAGWVADGHYAIDQAPVVLMIENYLTGFFWGLMRKCEYIETGLRRAGFSGGWLG